MQYKERVADLEGAYGQRRVNGEIIAGTQVSDSESVYPATTHCQALSEPREVLPLGRLKKERIDISLDGKRMGEVKACRYLGVDVTNDGKMNEEGNYRVDEPKHVSGRLQKLWKKRCVTREAKEGIYEGIVEPRLLYGFEVWGSNVHKRKQIRSRVELLKEYRWKEEDR